MSEGSFVLCGAQASPTWGVEVDASSRSGVSLAELGGSSQMEDVVGNVVDCGFAVGEVERGISSTRRVWPEAAIVVPTEDIEVWSWGSTLTRDIADAETVDGGGGARLGAAFGLKEVFFLIILSDMVGERGLARRKGRLMLDSC